MGVVKKYYFIPLGPQPFVQGWLKKIANCKKKKIYIYIQGPKTFMLGEFCHKKDNIKKRGKNLPSNMIDYTLSKLP